MAARLSIWDHPAGLVLAIVLSYAIFLIALMPFPAGRALLRRAAGFAGKLRRRR